MSLYKYSHMVVNLINNVATLFALVTAGRILIDRLPQTTLTRGEAGDLLLLLHERKPT